MLSDLGVIDFRGSPLCPTPADRDRFMDMNRRLFPTQNLLLGAMALLVGPSLATYRLVPALIALASVALGASLQRLCARFARPELPFGAGLILQIVGFTVAIVLDGRAHSGDLAILIWPTILAFSRFPTAAARAFAGLAGLMMVVAQLAFAPHLAIARPLGATVPLVALLAVSVFASAIRESDARHRREAIVDELTGLLNRTALHTRVSELTAQSRLVGDGVGLILADLDHFKAINDRHGHAAGDQVLREVASRLSEPLRAYDSVYRIGGEELAVLVPGAGSVALLALAERLRAAVEAHPVGGLDVTVSVGVARSRPGQELCWEALYQDADQALYTAKRRGRNRVEPAAEDRRAPYARS